MADDKELKEGLKVTSLFGGVQVFTILISIVKSKIVAMLLGPVGIGVNGLLDSTTQMISGFTGLGLGVSAVKDISEAHISNNQERITQTLTILQKLVWLTGFLGLLVCLMLSPFLSKLTFDSYDYITAFAAISVTLLFNQLTAGQKALLQGTRHFNYMAKATVLGSLIGLITSLPLYYFLGIKGIVPAIIMFSLITLILSWSYSRKVHFRPIKMSYHEAIYKGKDMVQMGFFISLQTMLSLLAAYIIRIFIGKVGGVADVGLFIAGFAIIDTYVGMVFTSMGTEYYPRLASHSKETNDKFTKTINQQIEITLILVSPLICIFLVFGNWAVVLLYSEKFLPITMMMCLGIMSNYFKAPAWSIAFSFLAKGDSRAFFLNELIATCISTSTKLLFYYLWGFTGIGFAFLLNYIIYLVQVIIICHYNYGYNPDLKILRVFTPQILLGIICFFLFVFAAPIIKYLTGALIIVLSLYISYRELNMKIDMVKTMEVRIKRRLIR